MNRVLGAGLDIKTNKLSADNTEDLFHVNEKSRFSTRYRQNGNGSLYL